MQANVKAQIVQILKDLGIGFVKASTGGYGSKSVILPERQKGLRGGSVGPLTVTSAHLNRNEEVQKAVQAAFGKVPGVKIINTNSFWSPRMQDLKIEIPLDDKKVRVLTFRWEQFQTYTASATLDPDYLTYWFVASSEDVKATA